MLGTIIKSVLLLFLIAVMIVVGLLVFDWLGLVSVRKDFAPVLELVGLNAPAATTAEPADLNDARLRQQVESLELRRKNLDEREKELEQRAELLNEKEQELVEIQKTLQEQQSSLEQLEGQYAERKAKVRQLSRNFNGMPPAQAVAQMNEMDGLLVVDVLRATDEIAADENSTSLSAYWVSLMPAMRAAEINRLLVEKP